MATTKSKGKSAAFAAKPVSAPPHPRPQLTRPPATWTSLNGTWDFAIDKPGALAHPTDVTFDRSIAVPFSPETPLSGINDTGFYKAVWYRRKITPPALKDSDRLILHFGAVDYFATVYINNHPVATHEGGYSPFSVDITEYARDAGAGKSLTIIVHAADDPHDLAKPRGKQDWHEHPHGIWYARTTGIWQSVWLETVPATHLQSFRWYADGLNFNIGFEARLASAATDNLALQIRLSHGGKKLAEGTFSIAETGAVAGSLQLHDPGLGDARNDLYWYPWRPRIIDAEITVLKGREVVDHVKSYTALRHVKIQGGRFWLNGSPIRLDLALDQGYWQESGLTAPSDDALKRDVELAKQMGFNGVRKHQKIEDPRWLYWADHLGLLVWSEFPACYRFSPQAAVRTTQQWLEAIQRDVSHPCIIAWVPFNESWGVPDLPDSAAQRALCDGLYHLTKAFDPSRPVMGNEGWELPLTDVFGIHDYDANPEAIKARYRDPAHYMYHERPGHKLLALPGYEYKGCPHLLTEFGGIAFSKDAGGTWGYSRARSESDLATRYTKLLEAVRSVPIFGGFCYTQLTDTYQEANGLLYMDRTPKFNLPLMNIATRGARNDDERQQLDAALHGT